jgi:hypothetical protein
VPAPATGGMENAMRKKVKLCPRCGREIRGKGRRVEVPDPANPPPLLKPGERGVRTFLVERWCTWCFSSLRAEREAMK